MKPGSHKNGRDTMKTKLTILLIASVAASLVVMRSQGPGTAPTQKAPPAEAPVASPVAVANQNGPIAGSVAGPDTIAETGKPETEIVMGIEVRKDRGCSVQRHYVDLGNGTVTDAYSCVPKQKVTDAYEHYSDDELRVLAYNDARAASVLGKRLIEVDLDESRRLLLRAVALKPAKLDPVMWLAAHAYSLRGTSLAAQNARANTYVLTRTAQAMGSGASIEWVLADLERAGFSEQDLAELEEQVRNNLRRIREIQLEVYGESVVDEVLL